MPIKRIDIDERKIDAIFRELDQCNLPGATVGIEIGDKPQCRKGLGLDLKHFGGVIHGH